MRSAGGNWIKFADAALGGRSRRSPRAWPRRAPGTGSIQIRLDSPTGPLVGTATVASTGNVYTYASTSASIRGASGRHDVYLVFVSGLRLVTFSLT